MPKEFNGRELKGIRWDFLEENEELMDWYFAIYKYVPEMELDEEKDIGNYFKKRNAKAEFLKKFRQDVYSPKVSFKELFEMANSVYQSALRELEMDNKTCWKLIWFFRVFLQRLWFPVVEKKYPGTVYLGGNEDPGRDAAMESTDWDIRRKAGFDSDPSEQHSQPDADYEKD